MRNFYNQPTNKIFEKMFGKGARQIQADPTLDISKCKCCQCDEVECKGCMEGHLITATAGCCPSKNEGLIFEYERPEWASIGPECCVGTRTCCTSSNCPPNCFDDQGNQICPPCYDNYTCSSDGCVTNAPYSRCCGVGKRGRSNVRFYYNYIGKYFKINYEATGKYGYERNKIAPRKCSYCDPTSHNDTVSGDAGGNEFYNSEDSCLDYAPTIDLPGGLEGDSLCTVRGGDIPWKNCKCLGEGQRKDKRRNGGSLGMSPRSKRLSTYRKRQMEKDPYYMWLLDIMCYDGGNILFNPAQQFIIDPSTENEAVVLENFNGTLYEHLVGVVHCEHWYEQATCRDLNPEHNDPNGIVGGWLMDPMDPTVPLGYNTSKLAPRFWIYACSGVPLFDFEIQDAVERGFITETDKTKIYTAFAKKLTPNQGLMKKLAAGGYLDVGDWRQNALSEIRNLRGNTFTAGPYGGIVNGDPNFGSCCLGNTCIGGVSAEYCEFTGGNFFPASTCSDSFCSSHLCSDLKYLGPVRKRWAVAPSLITPVLPQYPDLILDPNISNPLKARPNVISAAPVEAKMETFPSGSELKSLQLPIDLIQDPWNGSYPPPPEIGQARSEEFKAFELWKDAQWVYMHARPGGWSYVCPGYGYGAEGEELDVLRDLKIPDLPRAVGNGQIGGCLEGVAGIPQDNFDVSGCSLPDDFCYMETFEEGNPNPIRKPALQIPCDYPISCVGLECYASDLCSAYPEMGGGGTPCSNLAIKANCDSIRFFYFTQRYRGGPEGYYECARGINSYLYKVNITTGNYGQFCPHMCRNLQIPKQIANAVPTLFSSALAHREICDTIDRALDENPEVPPSAYEDSLCPSSYCFSSTCPPNPKLPVQPFYGPECRCCNPRINGKLHNPAAPSDYTHDASNRENCPFYPGPGYPTIYDGQFLGRPVEWNSNGCCWKCKMEGDIPVPDQYQGITGYSRCWDLQPDEIKQFDNFANTGRGFIYFESIDSLTSDCPTQWAGECACGTNSPDNVPPASSGEFCDPPGGSTLPGGPPPSGG